MVRIMHAAVPSSSCFPSYGSSFTANDGGSIMSAIPPLLHMFSMPPVAECSAMYLYRSGSGSAMSSKYSTRSGMLCKKSDLCCLSSGRNTNCTRKTLASRLYPIALFPKDTLFVLSSMFDSKDALMPKQISQTLMTMSATVAPPAIIVATPLLPTIMVSIDTTSIAARCNLV